MLKRLILGLVSFFLYNATFGYIERSGDLTYLIGLNGETFGSVSARTGYSFWDNNGRNARNLYDAYIGDYYTIYYTPINSNAKGKIYECITISFTSPYSAIAADQLTDNAPSVKVTRTVGNAHGLGPEDDGMWHDSRLWTALIERYLGARFAEGFKIDEGTLAGGSIFSYYMSISNSVSDSEYLTLPFSVEKNYGEPLKRDEVSDEISIVERFLKNELKFYIHNFGTGETSELAIDIDFDLESSGDPEAGFYNATVGYASHVKIPVNSIKDQKGLFIIYATVNEPNGGQGICKAVPALVFFNNVANSDNFSVVPMWDGDKYCMGDFRFTTELGSCALWEVTESNGVSSSSSILPTGKLPSATIELINPYTGASTEYLLSEFCKHPASVFNFEIPQDLKDCAAGPELYINWTSSDYLRELSYLDAGVKAFLESRYKRMAFFNIKNANSTISSGIIFVNDVLCIANQYLNQVTTNVDVQTKSVIRGLNPDYVEVVPHSPSSDSSYYLKFPGTLIFAFHAGAFQSKYNIYWDITTPEKTLQLQLPYTRYDPNEVAAPMYSPVNEDYNCKDTCGDNFQQNSYYPWTDDATAIYANYMHTTSGGFGIGDGHNFVQSGRDLRHPSIDITHKDIAIGLKNGGLLNLKVSRNFNTQYTSEELNFSDMLMQHFLDNAGDLKGIIDGQYSWDDIVMPNKIYNALGEPLNIKDGYYPQGFLHILAAEYTFYGSSHPVIARLINYKDDAFLVDSPEYPSSNDNHFNYLVEYRDTLEYLYNENNAYWPSFQFNINNYVPGNTTAHIPYSVVTSYTLSDWDYEFAGISPELLRKLVDDGMFASENGANYRAFDDRYPLVHSWVKTVNSELPDMLKNLPDTLYNITSTTGFDNLKNILNYVNLHNVAAYGVAGTQFRYSNGVISASTNVGENYYDSEYYADTPSVYKKPCPKHGNDCVATFINARFLHGFHGSNPIINPDNFHYGFKNYGAYGNHLGAFEYKTASNLRYAPPAEYFLYCEKEGGISNVTDTATRRTVVAPAADTSNFSATYSWPISPFPVESQLSGVLGFMGSQSAYVFENDSISNFLVDSVSLGNETESAFSNDCPRAAMCPGYAFITDPALITLARTSWGGLKQSAFIRNVLGLGYERPIYFSITPSTSNIRGQFNQRTPGGYIAHFMFTVSDPAVIYTYDSTFPIYINGFNRGLCLGPNADISNITIGGGRMPDTYTLSEKPNRQYVINDVLQFSMEGYSDALYRLLWVFHYAGGDIPIDRAAELFNIKFTEEQQGVICRLRVDLSDVNAAVPAEFIIQPIVYRIWHSNFDLNSGNYSLNKVEDPYVVINNAHPHSGLCDGDLISSYGNYWKFTGVVPNISGTAKDMTIWDFANIENSDKAWFISLVDETLNPDACTVVVANDNYTISEGGTPKYHGQLTKIAIQKTSEALGWSGCSMAVKFVNAATNEKVSLPEELANTLYYGIKTTTKGKNPEALSDGLKMALYGQLTFNSTNASAEIDGAIPASLSTDHLNILRKSAAQLVIGAGKPLTNTYAPNAPITTLKSSSECILEEYIHFATFWEGEDVSLSAIQNQLPYFTELHKTISAIPTGAVDGEGKAVAGEYSGMSAEGSGEFQVVVNKISLPSPNPQQFTSGGGAAMKFDTQYPAAFELSASGNKLRWFNKEYTLCLSDVPLTSSSENSYSTGWKSNWGDVNFSQDSGIMQVQFIGLTPRMSGKRVHFNTPNKDGYDLFISTSGIIMLKLDKVE